ncbi:MAG: VWFA-related domain protein [Acidobacteria bacterium]|nr:VWFA-related domain protein [Acidobacteriota bacterium]
MKLLPLFTLLLITSPLFAQIRTDPKVSETLDVNVVLLDALVTDAQGNQILGLGKDDFVVKENGVEQPIESVDYYTNRQLLNSPEERAAFKVERVHEDRYFIFFFDKPSDSQLWDRLAMARAAARRFVNEQMKPGDRVAIVGHDVRLKVYSDFTSDKQQLAGAIDQVAKFGLGLKEAPAGDGASILHNLSINEMIDRTGTVYEAITLLGRSTASIRARKNLILFSAGIREIGETSRDGILLNESRYYQPMIQALNSADVAVYAANLFENSTDLPIVHQTLDRITHDTNGQYFRHPVNYLTPLKEIERQNAGYYLITYHAQHGAASGYQKVDVSLKNPEFRVKARGGYSFGK